MRSLPRPLAVLLVPLLALLGARGDGPPIPLVRPGAGPAAVLDLEVRSPQGELLPARLTLVPESGTGAGLLSAEAAPPGELAVRDNLVYTRTGHARITVPAGRYTLFASHGLEWSLARSEVELVAGQEHAFHATLTREVDTRGWIGADFHLHTLTFSGHGDANLEERLISLAGEGLELAVATDHDHNTDYRPAQRALGLDTLFLALTGDEVSTPIGHFNAFPLDPAREPVDPSLRDANELFRRLHAETNPFGVVPLIQLNHPRLDGIDYFTLTGLDPVTGTSAAAAYSSDYDAIEILNENRALGYLDPVADRVDTHGHLHSVLRDWFHLLDRGARPAATGNSDSHHVSAVVAGYPRNYVRSGTDVPAEIRPAEVVAAVRAKELFTTTGPFVEFSVNDVPMGGEVVARDGHARLRLRLQAASWVDCDRVKVFVNGELETTLAVPDTRTPLRLEQELELCLLGECARHARTNRAAPGGHDAWVVVVVEGDDPLVPVLSADAPSLAITNPVWIVADGDGRWTPPLERLTAELRHQATPAIARTWFDALSPNEQALVLSEVPRGPFAGALLEGGLDSPSRAVRLASARAAEHTVIGGPLGNVQHAWEANSDDPLLGALLFRVLAGAHPERAAASIGDFVGRFGANGLRSTATEILPLFGGAAQARWSRLGPLPAGPEAGERPAPPGPAEVVGWEALEPRAGGDYVDLAGPDGVARENARVYVQTFLRAPAAGTVVCTFGSDDGARVWLGGRLLYENHDPKAARPLETVLQLALEPGWNRLLLEVENVTGGSGFYCRWLDRQLESRASAP